MKHLIITLIIVLTTCFNSYSQFSENGYKIFKLGMTAKKIENIINKKINNPEKVEVIMDGVKMELSFVENDELVLWSINTNSKNAKVEGIEEYLIGKHYDEIKKLLGLKLVPFELDGPSTEYYIYYQDEAAKKNEYTSCVLQFNKQRILTTISALHNP